MECQNAQGHAIAAAYAAPATLGRLMRVLSWPKRKRGGSRSGLQGRLTAGRRIRTAESSAGERKRRQGFYLQRLAITVSREREGGLASY